MRKERVVRIKSPELTKLRNNLRLVLRLSVEDRCDTLSKEIRLMSDSTDTSHSLKKENLKKREQMIRLNRILLHSISKCRVCSSYKNNVVYTRLYDYWLCVECYRSVQEYYRKKGESVSIRLNLLDPSFKC